MHINHLHHHCGSFNKSLFKYCKSSTLELKWPTISTCSNKLKPPIINDCSLGMVLWWWKNNKKDHMSHSTHPPAPLPMILDSAMTVANTNNIFYKILLISVFLLLPHSRFLTLFGCFVGDPHPQINEWNQSFSPPNQYLKLKLFSLVILNLIQR